MKDIIKYISEERIINLSVKCIKEFETKYHKFNTNETDLKANKINDNWWLIDSIGISDEDFKKHFKENNETN